MCHQNVRLTILNDCLTNSPGLNTGNDFSCIIQSGVTSILFGSINHGRLLISNMKKLGFDPKNIDLVFIANDNYDDLTLFSDLNPHIPILIPETIPETLQLALIKNGISFMHISNEEEIVPNVFSLGNFSWLIKEQAIIIKTSKGMIIIIGPAHYLHIGSILLRISDMFSGDPIHMVICGFQIEGSSSYERKSILEYFHILNVQNVALCLNSDKDCRQLFELYFKYNHIKIGVGSVIDINSHLLNKNMAAAYASFNLNQNYAAP
jgi:7,8-dihydropterin-6-yl-methyl-4-(beta-D-ribofuranosyl)aminobenzene 5'-phosphate synthase